MKARPEQGAARAQQPGGSLLTSPLRLNLGLRTKFFLYSNTLIVATMVLVTVLSVVHERAARTEAIERRGRSIVEALAISIAGALPMSAARNGQENGLILETMAQVVAHNRDFMRYVVVTDAEGTVTHATDGALVHGPFPRALHPPLLGDPTSATVLGSDDLGPILEVRTALTAGHHLLGTLAVGFSLEPVRLQVAMVTRRAILVALVLLVFNSLLTAVYVETLIRPILHLNQTMKWAGRGDLTVRASAPGSDEVGELAAAFNRMMAELEEARTREKLQRAQLAHTEKMVAVGTLAAGVAHEVNNPLAGVLACVENIQADPADTEMRLRYLELIRDGLKRIERTVANLLNFSRQRGITPEPTSINHNLRHVAELVAYQARKSGVEVRFDLDPAEPQVLADHNQMEQVFLNLMLNAIQAMPEGGMLTLRSRERDGKVVAEVSDTGRGIPAEVRDRIFDPFFTTREVGEGTGLGLAVSDSIVAAHGGTIVVDSVVGRGSSFRVTLDSVVPARGKGEQR